MNLHEFQAKELLKKYNVPVQEGIACGTVHEAEEAYRQIKTQFGSPFAVVKAQIHAGGRGKGKIKENGINGVKVGKGLDEVVDFAQKILGGTLVTLQTGPAGKVVHKILVAQDMYYDGPTERKEFYLSILLDRSKGQNVFMYSTEGGMNIEEVAHNTPEKIFKEWVHPAGGLQPFQARKIAFNLGLSGESFKNCVRFVTNLYNAYVGLDCSMLEINPLFKAADDKIVAVDCKMNLDDNALMRHPDLS
ncbi:MAG TPA: ATP-grasp domain-containing protein, partial [Chitinophagaceae bacterium]|nr:ATP-grasp domain-containing protein [Chitinophagaceae bacterium]